MKRLILAAVLALGFLPSASFGGDLQQSQQWLDALQYRRREEAARNQEQLQLQELQEQLQHLQQEQRQQDLWLQRQERERRQREEIDRALDYR